MKRKRWLAMAMAVVMTASSIPAGTFTAFAAEEEVLVDFADIDQQEDTIAEEDVLAEETSDGGDLLFAEDLLLENETDAEFFEEEILQDDSAVFEDGLSEDTFDEEDIEPEFDLEITDDVLEDGFLTEEVEQSDEDPLLADAFSEEDENLLPEDSLEGIDVEEETDEEEAAVLELLDGEDAALQGDGSIIRKIR